MQANAPQLGALLLCGSSTQLVEDVVGALGAVDADDPGALQEVSGDLGPRDPARRVKVHIREFAKSRTVVIPDGLGISKSLQQGIGLQNLATGELGVRAFPP